MRPAMLILGLLASCTGPSQTPPSAPLLGLPDSCLRLDGEGRVEILHSDGSPILQGAFASAMLDDSGEEGTRVATIDGAQVEVIQASGADLLGDYEQITLTTGAAPRLVWTIDGYPDGGFYTFQLAIENETDSDLILAKLSPLVVDAAEGGGLFLGADPRTHRILENGSYGFLDFNVDVLPGDTPLHESYANVAPGDFAGHSVSNWNHAVVDLENGAGWVAGALSFDSSLPVFETSYDAAHAPVSEDGRLGFTFLAAESAFQPHALVLASGASLDSERIYAHPTEPDALAGLERYASAVGTAQERLPWHQREAGRRVPNGWNSWSGSASTGGYGTDIDEETILANLAVMATELRDWGFDWFQIDDGYEPRYGDWWWDEGRFPHGAAWMSEQIRAAGLIPGLWQATFTPASDSAVVLEHPDWLVSPTAIGTLFLGGSHILDLSNPEVLAWITEQARVLHEDWGFDWMKLDFGYYALFGDDFDQAGWTREEAWHAALGAVREGLGEDAYLLLVGPVGLNYEADSGRLTLDTMPVWDRQPTDDPDDPLTQQGIKPSLRTTARRWYLQDRVWENHPDLIFFRSNLNDPAWQPLTFEESRAQCASIGLQGGIVKLGDRLVDLDADAINTLRTLVPIDGRAARPLDVLTREFPELWHLSLDGGQDGLDDSWEIFGLFHWGANTDMSQNPYVAMTDDGAPRQHALDLTAMGLEGEWLGWELWTEEGLGQVEGQLTVEVPSHDSRVVVLRRPTGHPSFLGWNRQISMGGVLVEGQAWDEGAQELSFEAHVAAPTEGAPFTYVVAFEDPGGQEPTALETEGVAVQGLESSVEGELLTVRFVPEETGSLRLRIAF